MSVCWPCYGIVALPQKIRKSFKGFKYISLVFQKMALAAAWGPILSGI